MHLDDGFDVRLYEGLRCLLILDEILERYSGLHLHRQLLVQSETVEHLKKQSKFNDDVCGEDRDGVKKKK